MNLDNYVDVATRLRLAYERFPEMRVVEGPVDVITVGPSTFVTVTMTVYRTPEDPLPAVGTAWEPIPGANSFTRNSEMMNASTSALGRVLGLMGLGLQGALASRDEVANRVADDKPSTAPTKPVDGPKPAPGPRIAKPATKPQLGKIAAQLSALGIASRADKLAQVTAIIGRPLESSADLTAAEASDLIAELTGRLTVEALKAEGATEVGGHE